MTELYNCRHSGDQYRISKFDSHFDLQSSYLCTDRECDCPAGHRPSCRHRDMLPKFLARGHIGDEWFYDHSRGGWVQGEIASAASSVPEQIIVEPIRELVTYSEVEAALAPQGVQVFEMDNILGIHNAIADAIGAPEARIELAPQGVPTPAQATIRRRV